jgi:deoxyadenosine/deoxycytidine kinase
MDGGLDLDFHGFTRLFLARGLLSEPEYDLCRRLYALIRESLPRPEFIIRLAADGETVTSRLSGRKRVNIASAEDTSLFKSYLDEWLVSIPSHQVLMLDVTSETMFYEKSIEIVMDYIHANL